MLPIGKQPKIRKIGGPQGPPRAPPGGPRGPKNRAKICGKYTPGPPRALGPIPRNFGSTKKNQNYFAIEPSPPRSIRLGAWSLRVTGAGAGGLYGAWGLRDTRAGAGGLYGASASGTLGLELVAYMDIGASGILGLELVA